MIENVLEIKDTHVREVMTPLVDVVAVDASATVSDFHKLWVIHQYSRYWDLWVKQFFYKLCIHCNVILSCVHITEYLFLSNVLIILLVLHMLWTCLNLLKRLVSIAFGLII